MFRRAPFATVVAAIALTAACSSTADQADTPATTSASVTPSEQRPLARRAPRSRRAIPLEPSTVSTDEEATLFDDSVVHDIAVSYDQADYDAMIDAYVETGEKEWIEATVTIDGVVYEQVGLRLKGNSSLAGLGGGRFPGRGQPPAPGPTPRPMRPTRRRSPTAPRRPNRPRPNRRSPGPPTENEAVGSGRLARRPPTSPNRCRG